MKFEELLDKSYLEVKDLIITFSVAIYFTLKFINETRFDIFWVLTCFIILFIIGILICSIMNMLVNYFSD